MDVKISRILHAGYVFECGKTQIFFDPIFENPFSSNCHAFPDVRFDYDKIKDLKPAAVFISHFHDDHCSLVSLDLLDRQTPIYVYCLYEELFTLIRELGFNYVYALEIGVAIKVGPIEVIPRQALDADVDSIFHIKAAGLNILNVVDSWIDTSTLNQLARSAPWDMVLWPFQTMREIEVIAPSRSPKASLQLPMEWIEQLKILNPRYVVPSSCQFVQESWSWYNHAFFPISYRQFQCEVKIALPNTDIVRLNPSVSIILNKNLIELSSPLAWVLPVGEQNVDYEYKLIQNPPTTAEISRQFAALTEKQTQRVYEYCLNGIFERYQALTSPTESYFKKSRLWQLSVYDHRGEVEHFRYRLNNTDIAFVAQSNELLAWTTEIPIAKFYAALECGETLTSMYMRINDMVFDCEIEQELNSADIVDDPLIRCLYSGVFGAYQAAQLKRIKGGAIGGRK